MKWNKVFIPRPYDWRITYMLETNHVRAALLKNLPLFLIITQIIYECNRSTHTCWLGKAYAGTTKRKEDEEEHAALPKTNKQTWKGEAKHVLWRENENRQRYILLWQPLLIKYKYKICNGNNFKNTLVDFIGNIKVKNNTPDGIYPIKWATADVPDRASLRCRKGSLSPELCNPPAHQASRPRDRYKIGITLCLDPELGPPTSKLTRLGNTDMLSCHLSRPEGPRAHSERTQRNPIRQQES